MQFSVLGRKVEPTCSPLPRYSGGEGPEVRGTGRHAKSDASARPEDPLNAIRSTEGEGLQFGKLFSGFVGVFSPPTLTTDLAEH